MSDVENYLHDVLGHVLEKAREAKADHLATRTQDGQEEAQFEAGRAMAYYEVSSHLLDQLDAFGIARARVGVAADFDAERELL